MAVRALQMLADRGWVAEDVPKKAADTYRLLDVTAGRIERLEIVPLP